MIPYKPQIGKRPYVLAVLVVLVPIVPFWILRVVLGFSWWLFGAAFFTGCLGGWAAVTLITRARRRATPVFIHNPAFDSTLLKWGRIPDNTANGQVILPDAPKDEK